MSVWEGLKDKIDYSWEHEKAKFRHMGNAKYFSLLNFLSLFTVFPWVLKTFWPYVQNSMNPIPFYVVITIIINIVTIGPYTLIMYFIYTKKNPFFQQYRSDPNMPWPWEQNKEEWSSFMWRTLKTDFWNLFVVGTGMLFADAMIKFDIKMKTQDCPDTLTIMWQFLLFLLFEEIFFYFFHRMLHHHKLYFLHKKHHQYKATISLAFVYSSSIEHMTNLITAGGAYTLLSRVYPVHIFTVIIWLVFRVIESENGHCGYNWPWAIENWIPFSSGRSYHFFHHSKNSGNFGAILHLFDTLFQTNKDFRKYETLKNSKEKKTQ